MFNLSKASKVLAFFAHPDDETLAAGATITKLAEAGAEMHVAIPATGIKSRRRILSETEMAENLKKLETDCSNALGILGVDSSHIYLGHFPDNEMDKHTLLELIHWLEDIIEKINPDVILTHHRFCTNIDHRYCHEAAVVATRPSTNSHISILCGEVPSSTGYLRPAQWEPNCYIGITENHLNKKIKAMQTYESEARSDPHPRSPEVISALSKVRGSESGFYFAESFMIQKTFG